MSSLSDALNEANVEAWSAREIARRGDDRIHFGTVANYLNGRHGRPSEDVLEVFSEVLKVPMPALRQLAGQAPGEPEPWTPPDVANRLDRRQRRVLDELIYMLADSATREEGDGSGDTAATIKPGQDPANVRRLNTPEGMMEMQDEAARPDED